LLIDGLVRQSLSQDLLRLSVEDALNTPARCRVDFNNWGALAGQIGYLYFNKDELGLGRGLSIRVGKTTLFKGKINAVEADYPDDAPAQIAATAEDRLADLRLSQHTRSFTDTSLADVLYQIGNEHGLRIAIKADVPSLHYASLYQHNQTDLEFLLSLTGGVGANVRFSNARLEVFQHWRVKKPLSLVLGSSLISAHAIADLTDQRTTVHVTGWDWQDKEVIDAAADAGLLTDELGGLTGGSILLSAGFGEDAEYLLQQRPFSAQEASSMAQAAFRQRARGFAQVEAVADGNPKLNAGIPVQISGLGAWFDGRFYVTRVLHRFDLQKGYRSEFQATRAGIGGYSE
jgi:phage protein D